MLLVQRQHLKYQAPNVFSRTVKKQEPRNAPGMQRRGATFPALFLGDRTHIQLPSAWLPPEFLPPGSEPGLGVDSLANTGCAYTSLT